MSSTQLLPNPRSIYLGNVDPQTTYEELIDHISGGNLDSVRVLADKQCAFVTFLSPIAAKIFLDDITANGIVIKGRQLKANWGKVTPVPADVERHVLQGATRAVFVGGTTEAMTEEFFRTDFERFGSVDTVKVLPDKRVAFIHFTSINYAIKAVAQLRTEEFFKGHKIDYGRDRSNRMPRRSSGGPPPSVTPHVDLPDTNAPAYRTVYLGNMDPETTPDELCAIVRGGQIDSIKMIPDKQHAFVAFVTADGAATFHSACVVSAPVVRGRTLKVGWGKESPLPTDVAVLVRQGATRNVYVGQIDDSVTPERLRADFSPFGVLESVAIVREKKCAFVAFLSIQAAAKAIQTLKNDPHYSHFKLNYGKDNCTRQPRSAGPLSSSNSSLSASNSTTSLLSPNGPPSTSPSPGPNGPNSAYNVAAGSFAQAYPPLGSTSAAGVQNGNNGSLSNGSIGGGLGSSSASSNSMFGNSFYYQPEPSPSFSSAFSPLSSSASPPPLSSSPASLSGPSGGSFGSFSAQSSANQGLQLHQPQPMPASLSHFGSSSGFGSSLFGSSSGSSPATTPVTFYGGYGGSNTGTGPSSSASSTASSGAFGFDRAFSISSTPVSAGGVNGDFSGPSSKSSSPAPGLNGANGYGASSYARSAFSTQGSYSGLFSTSNGPSSSSSSSVSANVGGNGLPNLPVFGQQQVYSQPYASQATTTTAYSPYF